MKRIVALLLSIMMVFALCACGAEAPVTGGKDAEPVKHDVSFEETVLVDNEYCKFTVKSIEDEGYEYVMKVELENKSETEEMFSVDYVSVNGWALDPFWAESVSAGMKANSEIYWSEDALESAGIEEVLCISFVLSVYDNEDITVDDFVEESFTLYPTGDEDFTPEIRESKSGDIVLAETDEYAVIVTGFDPDGLWGYTMNLYIYNKTDVPLMFAINDAAVNGYMCDPFWASSIPAGTQEMNEVTWSETELEDNGITEVKEISLDFSIGEEFSFDYLLEDTFVINP